MARSFDEWLNNLGPITRCAFGVAVVLTLLVSVNAFPFNYITLSPSAFTNFELWRIFTAAFFFGGFSFSWLFSIAMFVSYMNYNESYDFKGKSGDFLWMLLLLVVGSSLGGVILDFYFTSFALLMSLCWIFCKRHPELKMDLYGFEFTANTFPWILLLFNFIIRPGIMQDILGIFVGHVFFFFKDVVPKTHGKDIFSTPEWFLRYVMPNTGNVGIATVQGAFYQRNARVAPQGERQQQQQQHRWGQGHVLGSS